MTSITNTPTKGAQKIPRGSAPVLETAWSPLSIKARQGTAVSPLTITRVTHACVLIQWQDGALLTDPWFSEKPRYHHGESLPFDTSGLPDLTAVLSSMNHYDHFDVNAFSAYRDLSVPFVTITGSNQAEAARRAGFLDIRDLAAGASVKIGGATLHAIAANAFAPSTFRYEQCYVIEVAGRTILFCPHFPKDEPLAWVKGQFPNIDLALLGINGLRIKPLLGRQMSMDPTDAARVCALLDIPLCVPIHYAFNGGWFSSTFLLSHKGKPEQFCEAARGQSPSTNVVTLSPRPAADDHVNGAQPAADPDRCNRSGLCHDRQMKDARRPTALSRIRDIARQKMLHDRRMAALWKPQCGAPAQSNDG